MTESLEIIYLIILVISIIQSITGIGVLVLGTPIMLILEFPIIGIMYFLLPISLITSLLNIIFINYYFKEKIQFKEKIIKHFFLYCLISLLLGAYLLKNYSELINFDRLVALIIILSIIIKIKFINTKNINKNLKKIFLFVIGIVHGLTNSGGTLLTLLLFDKQKGSRIKIHFFYFVLAASQLIFLLVIQQYITIVNLNIFYIFLLVVLGSCFGNLYIYYFKKDLNLLIYILAIISSCMLLIKSFA